MAKKLTRAEIEAQRARAAENSERMAELLGANGMSAASDGDDADLVVLNTCHIREKAAEKAYSEVGRLRRQDGSKPLVALAGCVAQAEGAEAGVFDLPGSEGAQRPLLRGTGRFACLDRVERCPKADSEPLSW